MVDTGFLTLSVLSMVLGIALFLSPTTVVKLSEVLNRTLHVLDKPLIRYRYLTGVCAFVASYAFFKLALLLPSLRQ